MLEHLRRLPPHLFPLGEILLERFGARRGESGRGRRFERKSPATAARERRIVAAHLIGELLGLLQLLLILLAELLEIGAGATTA